ncbi:unnamed protein product [[Actinomadura] parvosata subsp. kistnae]|nr:unnamed protein product [Actinomadura parvosata subsp. kistnae]
MVGVDGRDPPCGPENAVGQRSKRARTEPYEAENDRVGRRKLPHFSECIRIHPD